MADPIDHNGKSVEADVWVVRPSACKGTPLLDVFESWLQPSEAARYGEITHADTKLSHLIGLGISRLALAAHAGGLPEEWRFDAGEHGKPAIAAGVDPQGWAFNVSHSGDMVVCAVTRGIAVGVDVEDVERQSRTMQIADRFFVPREVAPMKRLEGRAQRELFFAHWTLKEAFIKATGTGLHTSLSKFWFDLEEPGGIRFDAVPEVEREPGLWSYVTAELDARHRVALGVRFPGRLNVRFHGLDPLGPPESFAADVTRRSFY